MKEIGSGGRCISIPIPRERNPLMENICGRGNQSGD
jgi:hypothetical protein